MSTTFSVFFFFFFQKVVFYRSETSKSARLPPGKERERFSGVDLQDGRWADSWKRRRSTAKIRAIRSRIEKRGERSTVQGESENLTATSSVSLY